MALAAMTATSFTACSDDESSTNTGKHSEVLQKVLSNYVDNTVIPTYKNLADAAIALQVTCDALYRASTPTQIQVNAAAGAWKEARIYWEQSEAFLYGPANDLGIDPHIDSWPLDKNMLDGMLADDNFDLSKYEPSLLGFHGIEYVLFRDGQARVISDIPVKELKFAALISGDLVTQCIRLEASWAGMDKVTSEKRMILEENEVVISENFADNFRIAGQPGSRFKTQKEALATIFDEGKHKTMIGICDEVGATKIWDTKNVLDVESWYSWNSKIDFQDNIRGIENICMGGVYYTASDNMRDESSSIYAYIKTLDSALAEKLKATIATTIGVDNKTGIGTLGEPFRNHLLDAEKRIAVDACTNLSNVLSAVKELIEEQ